MWGGRRGKNTVLEGVGNMPGWYVQGRREDRKAGSQAGCAADRCWIKGMGWAGRQDPQAKIHAGTREEAHRNTEMKRMGEPLVGSGIKQGPGGLGGGTCKLCSKVVLTGQEQGLRDVSKEPAGANERTNGRPQ